MAKEPADKKAKAAPNAKAAPKASAGATAGATAEAAKAVAEKPVAVKTAPAPKPVREKKPRAEGSEPVEERNFRKTREGMVVSNKMQQTVVVKIERRVQHPLYGKVVLRSAKFKAHDIIGCDEGDRVEIMETRPLSKDKRWRVTRILEKVK